MTLLAVYGDIGQACKICEGADNIHAGAQLEAIYMQGNEKCFRHHDLISRLSGRTNRTFGGRSSI